MLKLQQRVQGVITAIDAMGEASSLMGKNGSSSLRPCRMSRWRSRSSK